MSSHRVLRDLFRAYESVGPGFIADPGNGQTINPVSWGQYASIVTNAAESRTLAQPDKAGILFMVGLDVDGGDLTLTVTGGYNPAGDTTITFGDAGDFVVFMSVKTGSTYQWTVVCAIGTNVNNLATQAITAAGTAVIVDGTINRVTLTNAINGAFTLAAPSAAMKGKMLIIEYIGAGTNNATLALTNVQGGSASTTATFNLLAETLILVGGDTKWNVIKEIGVTLT